MTRFGDTLETHMEDLSHLQINQIGIQILIMLEKVHETGFVYNDLKEDNVCVGIPEESNPNMLKLIDFGVSTKYLDDDRNHIQPKD